MLKIRLKIYKNNALEMGTIKTCYAKLINSQGISFCKLMLKKLRSGPRHILFEEFKAAMQLQ